MIFFNSTKTMQTRSSLSLGSLHSLAILAGIPKYNTISKNNLNRMLQARRDYHRLLRILHRTDGVEEIATKKASSSKKSIAKSKSKSKSKPSRAVKSVRASKPTSARFTVKQQRAKTAKRSVEPQVGDAVSGGDLNDVDPILFEPIGTHRYVFVRRRAPASAEASQVAFNLPSLVDYVLASGKFEDPVSRELFLEQDLREMDRLARRYELKRPSVLEAWRNRKNTYAEARFRADALQGLDRLAGEQVAAMLDEAESARVGLERTQRVKKGHVEEVAGALEVQLHIGPFPVFADLYSQIYEADADYARVCMSHYKAFLRGPPNRPFRDRFGFIGIALQFLRNEEAYAER